MLRARMLLVMTQKMNQFISMLRRKLTLDVHESCRFTIGNAMTG
ncbi:hypothetical protein MYA_5547 [Burkholderia sp. KJ006]|nr:hypothetical protein MYA_5547 [Burkholderia sp. KJ006]